MEVIPYTPPPNLFGATRTEDTSMVDGASWKSRVFLAALAMLGAWLSSSFVLFMITLTLSAISSAVSLGPVLRRGCTDQFVPLCCPADRYSSSARAAAWCAPSCLRCPSCFYRAFFQESPWSAFRRPSFPELFFPGWTLGFTLLAVTFYLVLLWRGSHLRDAETQHGDAG